LCRNQPYGPHSHPSLICRLFCLPNHPSAIVTNPLLNSVTQTPRTKDRRSRVGAQVDKLLSGAAVGGAGGESSSEYGGVMGLWIWDERLLRVKTLDQVFEAVRQLDEESEIAFPFMVRYLTTNGKPTTDRSHPPFALRYRRANGGLDPSSRTASITSSKRKRAGSKIAAVTS
jgi:hypothetical protein